MDINYTPLRVSMIKGIYVPAVKNDYTGIIDTIIGRIHVLDIIYVEKKAIPIWCEDCQLLLSIMSTDKDNSHVKHWNQIIEFQMKQYEDWINDTTSCN